MLHSLCVKIDACRRERLQKIMSRFGIFDTEASDTDFTANLYEEIVHFSWFPPEVSLPYSHHLRQPSCQQ